jgi:protein CpsI
LFYPKARIIRFPFDIRNAKYIILGEGFTCGRMCRIEVVGDLKRAKNTTCIEIGKNVRLGDFIHITALNKVVIGNNCGIGPKALISDVNHGNFGENIEYDTHIPYAKRSLNSKPVTIGNNVWIGESVCVLPGVTIGDGAIIGALSNVTKSIPAYSMAVGNPAKVIKRYNLEKKCWERVTK